MRIIPLGGAAEVGASSTIIEFGKSRLLVDAGIRIGEQGSNQLPDLSRLKDEAGPLDGIFLTHAHMDHSGALPLVHTAYPNVPIFMTPATAAVVRILLSDSLRLMEDKYLQESELPLYPPEAVESCLGCIRPIPFDFPITSLSGEVSAIFHPAGHILGASSISLMGRSGSVLLSGDISLTEQRTVPGMLPPHLEHDVVIVESTYGDRIHAHRPTQESDLIHTVADVVEGGGKVLFPAFAVGRAQEVILILQDAIARGELPAVPIFVDGLVQAVCDAYSRFPTYLQQHLRSSLGRGSNPFFPAQGTTMRVRSPRQREQLLSGGPCCIIASSGMMTGGPSAYYATHLVGDRRNMIAITGYQDEEAPGRRLLDLAEAHPSQRHLWIGERMYPVRCRVERYSLSAHADSFEIAGLMRQMSPSQGVVLVHGDGDARESLASTVNDWVGCRVFLPDNGEIMTFENQRRVFYEPKRRVAPPRIGGSHQPLDARALPHLHQALWAETGRKGLYRLADLHARWYGPQTPFSPEEAEELQHLLATSPYFEPDRKRPHLYRLRSPQEEDPSTESSSPPTGGLLEMNRALQCAAEKFPPETGLYKKGARQENRQLLLFFRFPQMAQQRYQQELAALEQETGWHIELNQMPHHAALDELARKMLPSSWNMAKNPSIMHEKQMVKLTLFAPEHIDTDTLQQQLAAWSATYLAETGYQLSWQLQTTPHTASSDTQATVKPDEPMEINRAYQCIDEAFLSCTHRPYKKSKKGQHIVLSFLTPEMGQQYQDLLQTLQTKTGWEITINPEPNLYGIKQQVRSLIPDSWGMTKDPAPLKAQRLVRIRLPALPEPSLLEDVAQQVYAQTYFHLEISTGD